MDAFNYCTNLDEVFVHPDNSYYCSIDGILFDKNKTKLIQYPIGKQDTIYSIPDGINEICDCAFRNCETLTNIIIPNSILRIGVSAFCQCKKLDNINIPNSVLSIENEAFNLCYGLKNLSIGSGVKLIGDNAFNSCKIINLIIPNNVVTIGDGAFSSCNYITEAILGKSVETIGIGIFESCENLQNINIQSGNEYFSSVNGVLFNKNQTKLIQYPGGRIGSYTIPSSVSIIAGSAFSNCRELSNIIIGDKVAIIEDYAFYSCSRIRSVIIPNGVKTIGDCAFCYCKELVSLTLGNKVNSIGDSCFKFCSLEKIYSLNTIPPTLSTESFDLPFFTDENEFELEEELNEDSNISESTCNINIFVPSSEALINYKANENWITLFPESIIKVDDSCINNSQQRIIVNDNNKSIEEEFIENEMKYYLSRLQKDIGLRLAEMGVEENTKDTLTENELVKAENKLNIQVNDDKIENNLNVLKNEVDIEQNEVDIEQNEVDKQENEIVEQKIEKGNEKSNEKLGYILIVALIFILIIVISLS